VVTGLPAVALLAVLPTFPNSIKHLGFGSSNRQNLSLLD